MTYYTVIAGWKYRVITWPNGASNYIMLHEVDENGDKLPEVVMCGQCGGVLSDPDGCIDFGSRFTEVNQDCERCEYESRH